MYPGHAGIDAAVYALALGLYRCLHLSSLRHTCDARSDHVRWPPRRVTPRCLERIRTFFAQEARSELQLHEARDGIDAYAQKLCVCPSEMDLPLFSKKV